MSDILETLKERGFFKQCTDEKSLRNILSKDTVTFYSGIDPTGPSCHIGHLVPIYASAHLQRAGHRPIILMGGGTALIGDPSGKTELRRMITRDEIQSNLEKMKPQIERVLHAGKTDSNSPGVIFVNNDEWLSPLKYIDFLREIGRHFSVNRMLSFEAYKQRMEKGLSFIEFNYQLLQSYDFLELYRRHGCLLQIGGDDQWGNIVAGGDLIRRVEGAEAYGLTFPLVTRSDGKKMGKTEKGALFLDPELTSVYDFYQYWRNVTDEDVEKFLLTFTFLPVEECRELGSAQDKAINESKERLAFEITSLLHGEEAAQTAQQAARAAFGGGHENSGMPSASVPAEDLSNGISAADVFVRSGLCSSKSEARRLIEQGGARINDVKVDNADVLVNDGFMRDGEIILKAGKKRFARILPDTKKNTEKS